MTTTPDMTSILEELAAGRIDAAEAARRIDALKATETAPPTPPSEPTNEELAAMADHTPSFDAASAESVPDGDAWAATTDRPQRATYTTESFAPPAAATSGADPSRDAGSVRTGADSGGESKPEERKSGPKPVNTGGVDRISVRAVGRRVRIVGETSVATLSADGPHVLRRNGSVLEVSSDGEMGSSLDGFSILRAPRNLDDIRSLAIGKELFLRVNPDIVVDVEVTAGSLNTENVPHLGKIRVTAGGAKLLGVEQVNDALIQAGQATIKGSITSGRSRVRAESGSLAIHLADDSNVTVKGDSQLGKVSWAGGHTGAGDEVVMGNGSARLDVEVVMGYAQVTIGSEPKPEAGVA
jgi:hypothetical protein